MPGAGWEHQLISQLPPDYRSDEVIRADNRCALIGAWRGVDPVLITAFRLSSDEAGRVYRRFLEARFLPEHPNLLRVLDAGTREDLAYAVTAPAEGSLVSQTEWNDDELDQLARDLVTGLQFLHSEHLVYCALRDETVYRSDGRWKLGDFHELRLEGKTKVAETRALMGRMPEVPPEAFEGLVSPAWDVWSFGVTMGKVLRRRGTPHGRLDAIVGRCLDANPETRVTLDEIARSLDAPTNDVQPSAPQAPPIEPPQEWRPRHGVDPAPSFLGIDGGTPPVEEHQHPVTHRRWLPIAAAGAGLGVVLTVLAFRHEPQRVPVSATPPPAAGVEPSRKPNVARRPAAATIPKPDPAKESSTGEADRVNSDALRPSIARLLDRWASSIRRRDLAAQMACYAPSVTRFYGRRNLNARELRSEKQRQFAKIGPVRNFAVTGLKITPVNPEMAIATFRKDWDFGGFAGSEADEMTIRLIDGEWKIAGETGKRLYWVRRASNRR